MAEFKEISREAVTIIDSFVKKCHDQEKYGRKTDPDSLLGAYLIMEGVNLDIDTPLPTYDEFVVSLYAMTPDADSRVLQELSEYRVDLTETLSQDEIDVLLKEFKAVIRYCSERDFLWWPSKSLSYILPSEIIDLCHSVVSDYCGSVVTDPRHRIFDNAVQHALTDIDGDKHIVKTGICGDVLFPFADDIQFAHALTDCSFDVNESNSKFLAFGQILKDAYLRDSEIHLGGSSGNADGKLYDYVFSCPIMRKDVRSAADELYNVADTLLKDNGVMCCLLPESFCYAPEWYGLRKILIDRRGQYSALVISLPDLLQPYVTGNMCLFCLFKSTKSTDNVVLVNAKQNDFLVNYGLWEVALMASYDEMGCCPNFLESFEFSGQLMLDAISTKNKKFMWFGSSTDLADNVNLLPAKYLVKGYFHQSSSGENCVKLGDVIDLVELSAHESQNKDEEARWLEAGSLSTNHFNCDISCKDLGTTRDDKKRYSKISEVIFDGDHELYDLLDKSFSFGPDRLTEKCLVASHSNGRLKVGRIGDTSQPYELSPEIIAFKVKSDKVSEDYLLMTLMSDEVAQQTQLLSWGGFYSSIDPEDFLQIEIPLPSKEEQGKLFREDVQKSLEKADKRLRDSNEEFRRDIHMKSHAMGQTIFALGGWLDVLQRARRENGGTISDDTVVGTLRQVAVGEIYDNLRKTVKHLQEQIYKMDRGNGMKKEDFALTTFIEEYVRENRRSEFEFEYNAGKHHRHKNVLADDRIVEGESEAYRQNHRDWNSGDGEPIEYVYFPKEALKIILDNIVSNACSHGFTDPDAKNIIKIEVAEDSEDDNAFLIRVSNNGKPIDEKRFPIANVFIYGSSSAIGDGEHFGLGGYEVKHLMWEFGGDAKLIPTPSEEFTVCYELKLPKGNGFTYKKND